MTRITGIVKLWLTGCLVLVAAWSFGDDRFQPILLPQARMEGGKPLMQALKERQTTRDISPASLSRQTLADLLWAAFGINRPENGHRTAPSAMNSQEIAIYVVMAEGTYLYEAKANRLKPVVAGDLRGKTGTQDFVRTAPVTLVFVADVQLLAKAKPADKERYAALDAGAIVQNTYLYCASAGLATVVHELDRAALSEALGLKPEQQIMIAQSVGFPRTGVGLKQR